MASSLIEVFAQWRVPPAQTRAIATALQVLMQATRDERGCLACRLTTEVGDQVTLSYEEAWATEGELERHIRSERFAQLAELAESATEEPRFEFRFPTGTRGLEYAEQIRRAGAAPGLPYQ